MSRTRLSVSSLTGVVHVYSRRRREAFALVHGGGTRRLSAVFDLSSAEREPINGDDNCIEDGGSIDARPMLVGLQHCSAVTLFAVVVVTATVQWGPPFAECTAVLYFYS